jgi:hypothetical protein
MTRQPTAKPFAHIEGVTYPTTRLSEAQIASMLAIKQRKPRAKRTKKKATK